MLGCVLAILSPAAFLDVSAYAFTGPLLAPSLIALVLILVRARPWTYLTAGILGALFPLFVIVVFNIIEGSPNPMVRSEFWATSLNVAALVLAPMGGISGFVRARRGGPAPSIREGWQSAQGLVSLAVFGLLLGAFVTSGIAASVASSSESTGYDFTPASSVSVVTENTAFQPKSLTIGRGNVTEISVENRDEEGHTFTYKKAGVEYDHEILPGASAKFLVLFDQAGTVKFWCKPHSGGENDDGTGMIGTITVV